MVMSGDQKLLWLTPEELAALPEGSPITVLWSGGKGPHEYRLHFGKWGHPCAERGGVLVGALNNIGVPPLTAVAEGWVGRT